MCSSLTTRCHHRPGPWMAPPPICTLGCPLENGSTRSSLSAHFRSRLRAWTSACIVQRDAVLGVNWRWSFFIVLFQVLFVLSFFYSFPPFCVVVSFIFFLCFFHFFLLRLSFFPSFLSFLLLLSFIFFLLHLFYFSSFSSSSFFHISPSLVSFFIPPLYCIFISVYFSRINPST